MKTMQKIMASALALTMAAGAGIGALADDEPIKTSGGSATVPVTISSSYTSTRQETDPVTGETKEVPVYDTPVFRVTLPASLPLTINADGSVTTPKADVFQIINGSAGPVKVTNVQFESGETWAFESFTASFDEMQVNSHKLGLSLTANEVTVKTGDTGEALKPNWTIAKGASLPIAAAAKASAVSATVTENNAASVIFTVGWDKAEKAVNEEDEDGGDTAGTIAFTINETTYYAASGMTWADWIGSSYDTSGRYVSRDYFSEYEGNEIYWEVYRDCYQPLYNGSDYGTHGADKVRAGDLISGTYSHSTGHNHSIEDISGPGLP